MSTTGHLTSMLFRFREPLPDLSFLYITNAILFTFSHCYGLPADFVAALKVWRLIPLSPSFSPLLPIYIKLQESQKNVSLEASRFNIFTR